MHIALLCIVLLCIDLELFVTIDCPDCKPCDCEECFSGTTIKASVTMFYLVLLKVLPSSFSSRRYMIRCFMFSYF
jgi:hypothetical protein